MSREAIRNANQLGVAARPILNSNAQVPIFRTRDQFERWRTEAIRKMEQGDSTDYYAWVQGESAGVFDNLPDTRGMNGALPVSPNQIAEDVAVAADRNRRFFRQDSVHPMLRDLGLENRDAVELREQLSLLMLDATPEQRPQILELINAVESSPTRSFHSIEWNVGDQPLVVEANSSSETVQAEHGLQALAIQPSVSDDPRYAGITRLNPDGGGEYNVYDDYTLQQPANDFHQGDAGANTQAPL